jgi:hypothetical protein
LCPITAAVTPVIFAIKVGKDTQKRCHDVSRSNAAALDVDFGKLGILFIDFNLYHSVEISPNALLFDLFENHNAPSGKEGVYCCICVVLNPI